MIISILPEFSNGLFGVTKYLRFIVHIFYIFAIMGYPDTDKLVRQLKKGDVTSFNMIFKNYNQKVYNFCLHLLKNNKDAEEVTQEVFVALWQNREKINVKTSFSAYIYGIARNNIFNIYRKSFYLQAYTEYLASSDKSMEFVTEDQVIFNELNVFLNNTIEKLPPKRKEVFMLSRNEGLTYREIAARLKISENTVDVQIRKALEFIKNTFDSVY